jgi:type II secretory pathway component PulC
MSPQTRLAIFSFAALIIGGALGYGIRDFRGDTLCASALAAAPAPLPVDAPTATATATATAAPASATMTLTIKGRDLDALLANPDATMRMARVVPNMADGAAHGMRLFGIRPDTQIGKSGFMNGDVVLRLNGYDLGSPDLFLSAAQSLKGTSAFDIDIERQGAPLRLHYIVER